MWLRRGTSPSGGPDREDHKHLPQTIGEAIRGNGIALGSVALLQSELTVGRLVRLTRDVLRTDSGYYLCHSKSTPLLNEAQRLAGFFGAAASGQNVLSP
ncbi:MAG: hypothetical protein ACTHNH_11320 [Mesorhizobium sp.]